MDGVEDLATDMMALYGQMKSRHSLVQISLLSLKSSTIFTTNKIFCIVILFSMTIQGLVHPDMKIVMNR